MSFGGSEQTSDSKSQTTLDPDIKSALLSNYGQTKATLAGTPTAYGGELVAPLNGDQLDYTSLLKRLSGSNVGTGTLDAAVSGASGLSGFTPQQVGYKGYTAASASPTAAGLVYGAAPTADQIKSYVDPNLQSTIDATAADLQHQEGIDLNQNAGSATMAGAFGSAGQALQDAATKSGYGRALATTSANLRSDAYKTAVASAQADADRKAAAETANQGTSLQTILANMTGANAAGQANAAGALTADQGNQSAGLAAGQLGLSADSLLGSLAPQQLGLETTKAGLLGQAGDTLQTQKQNVDTANQSQFQTNLQNLLALLQTRNQTLGLAGNPTIGDSTSTSQGVSLKLGK